MVTDEQNTAVEYKRSHRRFQVGTGKPQVADSGREQWRALDTDETTQVDNDVEDIRSHFRRHPEHAKRQKGATPRQYCGSKESGSDQYLRAKDSVGIRAAGKRSGNKQRAVDIQSTRELRLPFDGVPESAAGYEGDSNNYCRRSPIRDCMTHRESPSEFGYMLKTTSRAGRAG